MLADNLHNTSFREAVVKTFDGKHPCCLCKQIAQGKKSEKKTEFSVDLKKFDFWHHSAAFVFAAPDQFWVTDPFEASLSQLSQAPPTPPPRLV